MDNNFSLPISDTGKSSLQVINLVLAKNSIEIVFLASSKELMSRFREIKNQKNQ